MLPGELITAISVPPLPEGTGSHYLKVRDRESYEFALASAAVALVRRRWHDRVCADGAGRGGDQTVARAGGGSIAGGERRRAGSASPRRRMPCCMGRLPSPRTVQGRVGAPHAGAGAGDHDSRAEHGGRRRMSGIVKRAKEAVAEAVTNRALSNDPGISENEMGRPLSRVDGHAKVTGAARYPSDTTLPGMAYAACTRAPSPGDGLRGIDTSAAAALPGVLAVYTHENGPRLKHEPGAADRFRALEHRRGLPAAAGRSHPLRRAAGRHGRGRNARAGRRCRCPDHGDLCRGASGDRTACGARRHLPANAEAGQGGLRPGRCRQAALAEAAVQIERHYETPPQTNNPLGLFATVADLGWEATDALRQQPVHAQRRLGGRACAGAERWPGRRRRASRPSSAGHSGPGCAPGRIPGWRRWPRASWDGR